MWQNYTNVILGIVLIVIPFLDFTEQTLVWTLSILGIVISFLALWNVIVIQESEIKRI